MDKCSQNATQDILFSNSWIVYFLPRFTFFVHMHEATWITLSDTHTGTYMLTHTSVLHMVADRPTHVGGFVTIIRLIGPSLLGNITCTHKGLW